MSYAGVDYDDSYYLARAREENTKLRQRVTDLEAKLLKLTPKPREPSGLGAVVKDRDGKRWVRRCTCGTGDARDWSPDGEDQLHRYADIDAVQVLSPGVTL